MMGFAGYYNKGIKNFQTASYPVDRLKIDVI